MNSRPHYIAGAPPALQRHAHPLLLGLLCGPPEASLRANVVCRLRAYYSAYVIGGWDVLVFFDFLCMPQVPRSVSEQSIFNECLPNMGTLYSTFQVLALTCVPSGDTTHDYNDSGWCTCELGIAVLGKRLHRYSSELLASQSHSALVEAGKSPMDLASYAVPYGR